MSNIIASMNPIVDAEEQARVGAYVARQEARERHREPVDEAEAARLAAACKAAGDAYVALELRLRILRLKRPRNLQQQISELEPKRRAAEAAFIDARDRYTGFLCGTSQPSQPNK